MVRTQVTHYHSETGAIIEGQLPSHDPVAVLLSPSDSEVWRDIVEATNAKLADNQKRSIEIINAARLQGTLPPREKLQPLNQERQAIVMTGLQNLQNQISTEGWHVVERLMRDSGGGVMIRLTKSPK